MQKRNKLPVEKDIKKCEKSKKPQKNRKKTAKKQRKNSEKTAKKPQKNRIFLTKIMSFFEPKRQIKPKILSAFLR